MKLYQFDGSPSAKRARVVAHEVGTKLTIVSLDLARGEHLAPEFGAKNPNHMVPTLEFEDGTTLWESTAICTYLAETDPKRRLVSAHPRERAEVMRWLGWNASHLEAALATVVLEKVFAPMKFGRDASELKIAEAQQAVARFAPVLNAQLEGRAFVAGSAFSIADVCIATSIEFGVLTNVFDPTPYRSIAAWLGRVQARDAWQA